LTKLKPIGEKSQAENLKPWVKRRSTNMMKRQICTSICQKRILTNRWKQCNNQKRILRDKTHSVNLKLQNKASESGKVKKKKELLSLKTGY
jgi:arginyl-tRNA--protein-N-Asp/Glu arginylyltransferase